MLKELLFLAGDFCWCLAIGVGHRSTQQQLQDDVRASILELDSFVITKPHYFIDTAVFDMPLFIHLDEGDNPPLHQLLEAPTSTNYIVEDVSGATIVDIIDGAIESYKNSLPIFLINNYDNRIFNSIKRQSYCR